MRSHRLKVLAALAACIVFSAAVYAQRDPETITGTLVSYGTGFNTRMVTTNFTLRINRETPPDQAANYLARLQDGGQDALMRSIRDQDLGTFSVGNSLGRTINAVAEQMVNGHRRIYVVFERWTRFAEARGGYRSLDYPFGYVEVDIDPATGKGEGTYIAAAKIRWKNDSKNGPHVEVEDFATFPARLLNVRAKSRAS
jgi:hypothetical protein